MTSPPKTKFLKTFFNSKKFVNMNEELLMDGKTDLNDYMKNMLEIKKTEFD